MRNLNNSEKLPYEGLIINNRIKNIGGRRWMSLSDSSGDVLDQETKPDVSHQWESHTCNSNYVGADKASGFFHLVFITAINVYDLSPADEMLIAEIRQCTS
jgi:hypothetical protein